ncbi:MAG: hydroxymethylbilane synthase [Sphingobacteriia bacterium]|nr:hydroxymethylbilane synthase [Sphingobacteriia bacterium]
MDKIRIGTRTSKLAITQANIVKNQLINMLGFKEDAFEIIPIKTIGDIVTDKNISEIGVKGVFTKELEDALLNNSIDIAVHSMKDMPAELPKGLIISAVLEREDYRDAILGIPSLELLPLNAIIGTSSLRRTAQIKNLRSDLKIIPFRGNVPTRINKLNEGIVSATILAVSGLKRLGIDKNIYFPLDETQFLPAAAQGIIAIESREDNTMIRDILSKINHGETYIIAKSERAFLRQWEVEKFNKFGIRISSCQTPIAALAKISANQLKFKAMVADDEMNNIYYFEEMCDISYNKDIGVKAASTLAKKVLI